MQRIYMHADLLFLCCVAFFVILKIRHRKRSPEMNTSTKSRDTLSAQKKSSTGVQTAALRSEHRNVLPSTTHAHQPAQNSNLDLSNEGTLTSSSTTALGWQTHTDRVAVPCNGRAGGVRKLSDHKPVHPKLSSSIGEHPLAHLLSGRSIVKQVLGPGSENSRHSEIDMGRDLTWCGPPVDRTNSHCSVFNFEHSIEKIMVFQDSNSFVKQVQGTQCCIGHAQGIGHAQ